MSDFMVTHDRWVAKLLARKLADSLFGPEGAGILDLIIAEEEVMKVEMGCLAVDAITGFEGIVTGRCEYLYGCAQWGITPMAKDGEIKATNWFDEGRVRWKGEGVTPESVRADDNGPGDAPAKAHGRL